jgi:hypothetical protein
MTDIDYSSVVVAQLQAAADVRVAYLTGEKKYTNHSIIIVLECLLDVKKCYQYKDIAYYFY